VWGSAVGGGKERGTGAGSEVARVARLFTDSHFDFHALVRETMASPLVTFAKPTASTEETGAVLAIARREAFCARLEARLGVADPCNARGESGLPKTAATGCAVSAVRRSRWRTPRRS